MTKKKTTKVSKPDYANETERQKTARLGPKRTIVRWVKKTKNTRFAYLECGHRRSSDMTPRKTARCARCKVEGPAKGSKAA